METQEYKVMSKIHTFSPQSKQQICANYHSFTYKSSRRDKKKRSIKFMEEQEVLTVFMFLYVFIPSNFKLTDLEDTTGINSSKLHRSIQFWMTFQMF